MKTVQDIAETFHLKRQGGEYRGTCPICQARKAELAIWDDSGKLRCKCFYGCNSRDLFLVLVGKETCQMPPVARPDTAQNEQRSEWARRIWQETLSAKGTLVERYLQSRGITLNVPADIRFHPGLKHTPSGQYFPAMACAVRDVQGNIQAIHRTFLDLDGAKLRHEISKMSLGPIRGCAIQLAVPGKVLGLAEGVETALSAMQMSELPVWCAVSAGNMREVLLPDPVREVVIFGDNGQAGEKAANDTAAILHQEGRTVRIAYPPEGYGDFNDLLKGGMA